MRRSSILFLSLALAACGASTTTSGTHAETTPVSTGEPARFSTVEADPIVAAAVASHDRTPEDRLLDAGRQPAEVFTFFGIQEGWDVADLFAGGGYTTEILARIVGPEGTVLAQNNHFVLERFARAPLDERLARLAMPNVTAVELELDAPLPPGTHDLDAVIFILAYHDSVWQGTDRAAMNRAVFEALRPGGIYGIVDHSAAAGHGGGDTETLHRIEESVVVEEVLAAGFRLDARADILRNTEDARDWNSSPTAAGERRGTSDRFVLRFVRP